MTPARPPGGARPSGGEQPEVARRAGVSGAPGRPAPAHGKGGKLPTLAQLAWRNIWRNRVRSVLTIGALSGSLVLLVLYLALVGGMTRQMVEHATDLTIGHLQVQRQAFIADQDLYATLPRPWLAQIEQSFPGMKVAPRLYASALASAADTSVGVRIEAIDPAREARVTRLLDALRSGSAGLGKVGASNEASSPTRYDVIVGAQLAKNLQVDVGDELVLVTQAADASIGNALYRIGGILKPVDPAFDRSGVLMSVAAYRELMALDAGFHELSIRLDDVTQLPAAQAAVARTLDALQTGGPDAQGDRAVVRNWRQIVPALADMIGLYEGVVWAIGLIVVALAALGMLNTMLMAIHERTREFGILRAIGMDRGWLLSMVLIESLLLALVSAAVGTSIGVALVRGLFRGGIDLSGSLPEGFDFAGVMFEPVLAMRLDAADLVYAAIMVVVVTMIAAFVPSWRVMRIKPAEAMR